MSADQLTAHIAELERELAEVRADTQRLSRVVAEAEASRSRKQAQEAIAGVLDDMGVGGAFAADRAELFLATRDPASPVTVAEVKEWGRRYLEED
jgi:hypothetical protein